MTKIVKEFYYYGDMLAYLRVAKNIKNASFSYDKKNDIWILTITELMKD